MTERFWNAIADVEEIDLDDERMNRELRFREIARHLDGIETVLDIGGGTGAFSIPLCRRGLRVTHLDVSPAMLERARTRAASAGVELELVLGDAQDLSRFADRTFDLVLNMDGAVSFSADPRRVLAETCRVARSRVVVTASNRATMVATWLKYSLKATGTILPAVREMATTGRWHKDQFPDNALIYPAVCDIESLQAFTPAELAGALRAHGVEVLVARSIGSLTHLLLPHAISAPEAAFAELADLSETFDLDVMPEGPGSFRRAGVIAVARPSV